MYYFLTDAYNISTMIRTLTQIIHKTRIYNVISNGTLSQSKINERYFLMHPEFFIFDRMTIIRRSASYITYKEASLVKTNNKIIVQKFRVQFTY